MKGRFDDFKKRENKSKLLIKLTTFNKISKINLLPTCKFIFSSKKIFSHHLGKYTKFYILKYRYM